METKKKMFAIISSIDLILWFAQSSQTLTCTDSTGDIHDKQINFQFNDNMDFKRMFDIRSYFIKTMLFKQDFKISKFYTCCTILTKSIVQNFVKTA